VTIVFAFAIVALIAVGGVLAWHETEELCNAQLLDELWDDETGDGSFRPAAHQSAAVPCFPAGGEAA
jgi:hypothetical protein